MYILIFCLVVLLTAECMCWGITMLRHSFWVSNHPDYEYGMATTGRVLCLAVLLSSAYMIITWTVASYHLSLLIMQQHPFRLPDGFMIFMVIASAFTYIHMWAIIGRYTCLHTAYWPPVSKMVSWWLKDILDTRDLGQYCQMFEKWNQISERRKEHRGLLVNFLDIVPDMVWTKDMNDRYTYINHSAAIKIFLHSPVEVLGKTNYELGEKLRGMGREYTLDDICHVSDRLTRKSGISRNFVERGIVNGKFMAVHVIKCPIYREESEGRVMIGTIGVGHDITASWKEHEHLEALFLTKDLSVIQSAFRAHKDRFETQVHRDKDLL